ncbi:MAG: hypothetical protein LBE08_09905, partial [Bifidobacteriaceae bacterium]|nr:hypothetical protein [Bifidobacteriaceae bacterium]
MSALATVAERRMVAEAARLYYLQDMSKTEIGERLGVSRFKVARLLEAARADGIVTINIKGVAPVSSRLSQALSAHWGIPATVVDSGGGKEAEARRAIGEAAAELMSATIREGEVIGLAWGRTLTAMADHLTQLPRVDLVQLTGAVTADLNESPVALVRTASNSTEGRAYPIIAPAIVGDLAAAQALRRHPDVRAALELFGRITTAVIAVGSWSPAVSQLMVAMPAPDRAALQELGVRAEVAGIFFDSDGEIIGEEYTNRYLTISAGQMQRIPRVVAVAGGTIKLQAVRAVVRSGLVTELVTDHTLAESALRGPAIQPRPNNPVDKPDSQAKSTLAFRVSAGQHTATLRWHGRSVVVDHAPKDTPQTLAASLRDFAGTPNPTPQTLAASLRDFAGTP